MGRRTTTGNEFTIDGWEDNKSTRQQVCVASNYDSSEAMSQLYKDVIKIPKLKLQPHNHFLLTTTTR